jgi:hypothetical protein
MAGATGLEAVAFCGFAEESDKFPEHVHNWAHKEMSRLGTTWRELAR